jgi:hypothetical protein
LKNQEKGRRRNKLTFLNPFLSRLFVTIIISVVVCSFFPCRAIKEKKNKNQKRKMQQKRKKKRRGTNLLCCIPSLLPQPSVAVPVIVDICSSFHYVVIEEEKNTH